MRGSYAKRPLADIRFDRYTRQYARREPPPPGRAARQAEPRRIRPMGSTPLGARLLGVDLMSKRDFGWSLASLVDLFRLRVQGPPIAKQKRFYEEFHDAKGRKLLREVRVIDRRPLKEIRRTRREQVV